MNRRQHALLARTLIERCGGLEEIGRMNPPLRVKRSTLAAYQQPETQPGRADCYMPADVIEQLEAYCGEPVYSRALVENRPFATMCTDLLAEVCEVIEGDGDLLRETRAVIAGGLTLAGVDALRRRIELQREALREAEGVLDRRGSA